MSLKIGSINICDPVLLAPMSGITDLPFRKLVKRYGAGLVISEMIASRAMIEESCESLKKSENCAEEFPMAVQLAGCEPDVMAEAARMNEARGAAIIDINFGCPVKKIVKKFGGSALMKDEKLAIEIMEATVKAVKIPVTVKMRLGWDWDCLNAPTLAKAGEEVGIQMVTVHGRTRNQLYQGKANWETIRSVKDVIKIPLIVNGDISTPQDAKEAMRVSGADGVMIGRAAQGKPWLLHQIIEYIKNGKVPDAPGLAEIRSLIKEHYTHILDYYGTQRGVALARKHIGWYCAGIPNFNLFRSEINKITNPDEVLSKIDDLFLQAA
ncbi:MAG: tRNA dihydrouridine synthase DusB [Alphaproteobacteria bacterium]|nr:tRNA dihydrouridine synthase DusB [Alphaproteobacteria bacterium]